MRALPLALGLLAAALFAHDETPAEKDPYRLNPDHERTPFSAAEIRAGCPAGRVSIFRMENIGGARLLQVFHFVKNDGEGADFTVAALTPDGQNEVEQSKARSTWVQFQSHASFPKDRTTRSEVRVETPAGRFDCWKYIVVERQGDKNTEKRLYFAKRLPGPPVKVTMHVDGKQAFEMMLVDHKDGDEVALLASLRIRGLKGATEEQKAKYAAEYGALKDSKRTAAEYANSRAYADQAAEFFEREDADASGALTPGELRSDLHLSVEEVVTYQRLFWRLDHDADGAVSRAEFLDAVARWTR